jgi:hypothetical protein
VIRVDELFADVLYPMQIPVYTELIKAIAQLAWPLLAAGLLIAYRKEIRTLLRGMKRGKFMGFEIEEEAERAAIQVERAEEMQLVQSPQPPGPSADEVKSLPGKKNSEQAYLNQILDLASRDRSVALIRIFNEVENEVRQIVATFGLLQYTQAQPRTFVGYVNLIAAKGYISRDLQESLLTFWKTRNLVVHSVSELPPSTYISVLDTGIRLLGMLRSIPRETNRVAHADVSIFSDSECRVAVEVGKAVILETTHVDGRTKSYRIYPTTRHYVPGQTLSWEWDSGERWGQCWYRDAETNEIKSAWSSSMGFAGRPLETIEY